MKYQYDQPIPDDLVVMPRIELLGDKEAQEVAALPWYEAEHPKVGRVLLVSAKGIDYWEESDLEDATGVKLADCQVSRVAEALKRWSWEDGFYHA